MSFNPPVIQTKPADSVSVGPFGRQRVTNTTTLWDHKNIHSKYSDLWQEVVNGGGTITHLSNESAVALQVGTAQDDYAIRSTTRYFPYASGNGHLIAQTGVFAASQVGLVQEIGYMDGPMDPTGADWGNGFCLRLDEGGVLNLVIRSDVNEDPLGLRAVNETVVPQSSWNIDVLNGDGPSRINLDITKAQIGIHDFQWLGVGRVRCSLDINGVIVQVHDFNHANIYTAVYMRTPTLPITYRIWRKVAGGTTTYLKEICSTVKSEGSYLIPGLEYAVMSGQNDPHVPTPIVRNTVGATGDFVLILRLANNMNGMKCRKILRFLDANLSTSGNNAVFRVAHIHNVTSVDAYWIPIVGTQAVPGQSLDLTNAESGAMYAWQNFAQNGNPKITGGEVHFFKARSVAAAQGGKAASEGASSEFLNNHVYAANNFDATDSEYIAVYAQSETGTADVLAMFDFGEVE